MMAQDPNKESLGSIVSIILAMLEVQVHLFELQYGVQRLNVANPAGCIASLSLSTSL